jgi:hypothetical protein
VYSSIISVHTDSMDEDGIRAKPTAPANHFFAFSFSSSGRSFSYFDGDTSLFSFKSCIRRQSACAKCVC